MNNNIKKLIEKYQFEDTKVDKFILKVFKKILIVIVKINF